MHLVLLYSQLTSAGHVRQQSAVFASTSTCHSNQGDPLGKDQLESTIEIYDSMSTLGRRNLGSFLPQQQGMDSEAREISGAAPCFRRVAPAMLQSHGGVSRFMFSNVWWPCFGCSRCAKASRQTSPTRPETFLSALVLERRVYADLHTSYVFGFVYPHLSARAQQSVAIVASCACM